MTATSECRPAPSESDATDPSSALAWADRLLREADPDTAGLWPRTTAHLIRVALERAVNHYWFSTRPEMLECPTTMRLFMLEGVLNRAGARNAYFLWSQLSDATHPHPYELAPTAIELRRWHSSVTQVLASLHSATALRPPDQE